MSRRMPENFGEMHRVDVARDRPSFKPFVQELFVTCVQSQEVADYFNGVACSVATQPAGCLGAYERLANL